MFTRIAIADKRGKAAAYLHMIKQLPCLFVGCWVLISGLL